MFGDNLSVSTRIGFKLASITAKAVEQYVIAGKKLLNFLEGPRHLSAKVKASVPFAHPIAYLIHSN